MKRDWESLFQRFHAMCKNGEINVEWMRTLVVYGGFHNQHKNHNQVRRLRFCIRCHEVNCRTCADHRAFAQGEESASLQLYHVGRPVQILIFIPLSW